MIPRKGTPKYAKNEDLIRGQTSAYGLTPKDTSSEFNSDSFLTRRIIGMVDGIHEGLLH